MERVIAGVGVCMLAVLAPWWVAFACAIILACIYPEAPELIVVGFLIDALHASTAGSLWSLGHLVYTLGGTVLFLIFILLRRTLFTRAHI